MNQGSTTADTRHIGVVHRMKKSSKGDFRPTKVCIASSSSSSLQQSFSLIDDDHELDFVYDRFPTRYRPASLTDNLTDFLSWQIRSRELTSDENPESLPINLIFTVGKKKYLALEVPDQLDGLKAGDRVAMVFGGSGGYLAYNLAQRAKKIGATIWMITPHDLNKARGSAKKNDDHILLARLLREHPELFREAQPTDMMVIQLREALWEFRSIQKDRIACQQRLGRRIRASSFISDEQRQLESMHDRIERARKSDVKLLALVKEEAALEREVFVLVHSMPIWEKVLKPIEGCGEMIAAQLIASIGNIERFPTAAKFRAFCGLHVIFRMEDEGKAVYRKLKPGERPGEQPSVFPKRQKGEADDWNKGGRQAFHAFADQCNRRPNSHWGTKLRDNKTALRMQHPNPVKVPGRGSNSGKELTRYTDLHILRMALRKTMYQFSTKIYRQWRAIAKS